ncbi:hypothetical protein GCM10022204_09990 [Microlunatus aurantiacus]|uniref:Uncharacterized protein n=1 Tax=Microlunatus aurantiacus TaxID=446786 RepID=A0ABP7CXL1_9ACTN
MSAEPNPTCGRAAAMFSTLTASTPAAEGFFPVNGSTAGGRGVAAVPGGGLDDGAADALALVSGGATAPDPSP